MSDTPARNSTSSVRYELRVKGHLDARWTSWFNDMTLTHDSDGTTAIDGPVVDQAALHGLLSKLRDLGLTLLSVTQVGTETPTAPPALHTTRPGD